jgi:hypothetical protein
MLKLGPGPGFCPGFSEYRVFTAGMKIVIDKNLETVWQYFGRLFNKVF